MHKSFRYMQFKATYTNPALILAITFCFAFTLDSICNQQVTHILIKFKEVIECIIITYISDNRVSVATIYSLLFVLR